MTGKGYAFLIVGHSNFGKSETLWALTDYDDKRVQHCTIADVDFFLRHMSNDEQEDRYKKFVEDVKAESKPNQKYHNFISAFCPRFSTPDTARFLRTFKKRHDIYAMVIKQGFKGNSVTDDEIAQLSEYTALRKGILEFKNYPHDRDHRAGVFRSFIARTVRRRRGR